jgi:pyruvate-formate lyase-activating enzyme
MTFSLRLTADLTLTLAARKLGNGHGAPPILELSPDSFLDSASFPAGSSEVEDVAARFVARVPRYRSRIIWIGGSEPLDHPKIARFTNALAASGRHVFLATSGASLKRRLHEFQPSSRFYFTVRFDGFASSHDPRNAREGAFRVGLEALRMARLAGFFTCAQLVLHPNTDSSELEELHTEIRKLDVDGFLITRAALTAELEKAAKQLRRRLLKRHWALVSKLVDSVVLPAAVRNSRKIERQPIPESQPGKFGEGAEAG